MLLNHVRFTRLVIACAMIVAATGCDAVKDNQDVDAGPDTLCEFIPSPTGLYCHYTDPFTLTPECKGYTNSGWDETSIATDCESPMGAAGAAPGEVNETPCDPVTSLGSCVLVVSPNQETLTWFYDYEDAKAFQGGCENYQPGTFCFNVEEEEATTSSDLLQVAVDACVTNDDVTVTPDSITDEQRADMRENGGYIFFVPASPVDPAVGITLYPGGRVDSRSFAPAAQMLAKQGYYVAIFPMPDYMALGDAIYRADKVMSDHPEITNWLATGHSMGGTAAGQYLHDKLDTDEADNLIGLVIMGSYLDVDHDLSDENVRVMMMYGSEERIANADKHFFDDAWAYLPTDPAAIDFEIDGGFHFGFCFSENPRDDEIPILTQQQQHDIFVPRIVTFIEDILS
ncbi:MAG: hypothetical protein GY762_10665 [Proteobacteria bacterium]|nr:hypothetical protein [Pseudomonadota bacterium]